MFRPKYKFSYDEIRIIVMALVELKNQLIYMALHTGCGAFILRPDVSGERIYYEKDN